MIEAMVWLLIIALSIAVILTVTEVAFWLYIMWVNLERKNTDMSCEKCRRDAGSVREEDPFAKRKEGNQ